MRIWRREFVPGHRDPQTDKLVAGAYHKVPDGVGFFEGWGVHAVELSDGCASETAAIVVRPDATVTLVAPDLMKFIPKAEFEAALVEDRSTNE